MTTARISTNGYASAKSNQVSNKAARAAAPKAKKDVQPSTKVDRFAADDPKWQEKSKTKEQYEVFRFEEGISKEEKTSAVNRMIAETIQKTGIGSFEGENLYEITSEKELKKALDIINHGVAKKEDYSGRMFKGYTAFNLMIERLKERVDDDPDGSLPKLARSISSNQAEYNHYFSIFRSYKSGLRESLEITAHINRISEIYGTDVYLGLSLYDAENEETVIEASNAFKKAAKLTSTYGVTAYNGAMLLTLSKYELDGLEEKLDTGDLEGCEVDRSKIVEGGKSAAHAIKVKPLTDKLESFLSAQPKYRKTVSNLSFMVGRKGNRAHITNFYDYHLLCKEILLIFTDPVISSRLPKYLRKKAGKKLDRMASFFETIADSKAVQAEMDLDFIGHTCTEDKDLAEVEKYYSA